MRKLGIMLMYVALILKQDQYMFSSDCHCLDLVCAFNFCSIDWYVQHD